MKEFTSKENYLAVIGIIIVAAVSRLLPHPPNVTPVSGMALLGAAYLTKKYLAFLMPFIALFVSDFIINNTIARIYFTEVEGLVIWQDYMLFTYLGFAAMILIGFYMKNKKKSLGLVTGTTILATLAFFVISNFGDWMGGFLYPKTIGGLITCYVAAVPFLINSILGNIFFAFVLFGAYHMVTEKSYKVV